MIKIILFTFMLSISSFAACINNKKTVEADCKCRQNNSCFKYESAKNKKWYSSVFKSKVSKQLLKVKYDSDAMIEKLFSGEMSPYDPALDKMFTKYDKIEKIKDRGLKRYEANLKKRGVKNWKVENRIKVIKKAYNGIKGDKNILDEMNKVTGGKLKVSPRININSPTSIKKLKDKKKAKDVIAAGTTTKKTNTKPTSTIASADSIKAAQEEARRMRNKNFKFDTIIKEKDKSIFDFISSRYQKVKSKLNLKAQSTLPAKDKAKLVEYIKLKLQGS
jgi:hypothetical protein